MNYDFLSKIKMILFGFNKIEEPKLNQHIVAANKLLLYDSHIIEVWDIGETANKKELAKRYSLN
jgi:hypothetical protein